jgi:vacuolar-type H+-ATPase subunit H
MEEEQLEQASQDMDADIQKLVLKHYEMDSAFYKSINDKARGLIADAKRESGIILQDAEKEAESILAVAVQDAEKKAEAILAGATEETQKWAAEKQKWEAEKTALAGVQHFEAIVKLNVGGVRVITSLQTLCRFPDTMMGSMFSGRHTLPKGEDGYYFIDKDGTHFRHILNFLRSPESYKMEVEGTDAKELHRECEYYCLDELMFPFTEIFTEKILTYILNGIAVGGIAVLVDGAGVHTIRDSGEKIECCPRCHYGSFINGKKRFYFPEFTKTQSPPAAQPKVHGRCPACREQV